MNYDNIINSIVEEIYKKINNIKIENKKTAVLLWSDDINDYENLNNEFNVIKYNENIIDCDIVIVSKLCMRGLCNLSRGSSNSKEERFILKMLMKGKRIFILEDHIEYRNYKSSAPIELYKKFVSYEDKIRSYGVSIVKDISNITLNKQSNNSVILKEDIETCVHLINTNSRTKTDNNSVNKSTLDLRYKKLISESDFRKMQVSELKEILVNKRSIVTPLANDYIRFNHLKLTKV